MEFANDMLPAYAIQLLQPVIAEEKTFNCHTAAGTLGSIFQTWLLLGSIYLLLKLVTSLHLVGSLLYVRWCIYPPGCS